MRLLKKLGGHGTSRNTRLLGNVARQPCQCDWPRGDGEGGPVGESLAVMTGRLSRASECMSDGWGSPSACGQGLPLYCDCECSAVSTGPARDVTLCCAYWHTAREAIETRELTLY